MWAWALLPVFLALWGIVGLWLVFFMAVLNESVDLNVRFPYISVCGSYPRQSSVFSVVCNGCAFLAVWISVIRYQQVRDLGDKCRYANLASLVLGLISSAGVSLLGNFQITEWFVVHNLSALLAFCLGLLYFWLQLWLTLRAEPSVDRHWVAPLRAFLCGFATLFLIAMIVLASKDLMSQSAKSEWALVMTYFLLFGLFAAEFRHVDCFKVTVQIPLVNCFQVTGQKHTAGVKSYGRLIHDSTKDSLMV